MAAPLVLRWSIHSRDACLALERLIAWLDFYGPIWRKLVPSPSGTCRVCGALSHPGLGCGEKERIAAYMKEDSP